MSQPQRTTSSSSFSSLLLFIFAKACRLQELKLFSFHTYTLTHTRTRQKVVYKRDSIIKTLSPFFFFISRVRERERERSFFKRVINLLAMRCELREGSSSHLNGAREERAREGEKSRSIAEGWRSKLLSQFCDQVIRVCGQRVMKELNPPQTGSQLIFQILNPTLLYMYFC